MVAHNDQPSGEAELTFNCFVADVYRIARIAFFALPNDQVFINILALFGVRRLPHDLGFEFRHMSEQPVPCLVSKFRIVENVGKQRVF
jgi:hypothetical protein